MSHVHVVAGISFDVLGIVALAGVLHAGWNAAAHAITDRMAAQVTIAAAYTIAAAPIAMAAPTPDRGAWPFLVASALMHLVYTAQLVRSYRLGDFGLAYPVARSVAPVIVVGYSVAVLGEHTSARQWIGVALLCLAVYTLIDAVGVRRSESIAGYLGWMFLLQGPLLLAGLAAAIPPRRMWVRVRPFLGIGLASGLVSFVAYAAVIWAQAHSPNATGAIAAIREVGVVIAALLGRVLYREPLGGARSVGAVIAFVGIVTLSL